MCGRNPAFRPSCRGARVTITACKPSALLVHRIRYDLTSVAVFFSSGRGRPPRQLGRRQSLQASIAAVYREDHYE
eukprot:356258-Chlamydomonas_euryale.AAC.6